MSNPSKKRTLLKSKRRIRSRNRVRNRVVGTPARPRLTVRKSLRYIYAQVIDDLSGTTLASASSLESAVKSEVKGAATKEAAKLVGEKLAERAKDKGVEAVVFDRAGAVYHGRVKELADGARGAGLAF